MKKIILISILIFSLTGFKNELPGQEKMEPVSDQIDSLLQRNDLIVAENQGFQSEVARLKKDKNEKIEIIRQKQQTIVTLAAVITVLTILCLIFFFAYRSVRRRKRIDIAELHEEVARLKSPL